MLKLDLNLKRFGTLVYSDLKKDILFGILMI
jgi:hypothetical protein